MKKNILSCNSLKKRLSTDVLVSIIVPVYNTPARLLKRSIQSLLDQSYSTIEIIIVDDGSKSDCLNILQKFVQKDRRIRLLRNQHEGVSHARNCGISVANGEWLAFVDADDEASQFFIEEALRVVLDSNADFVCGSCQGVFTDSVRTVETGEITYYQSTSPRELFHLKNQMLGPFKLVGFNGIDYTGKRNPAEKLFRTSLVQDLRFDENISICEDVLFNYRYIERCSSVVIVNRIWYWYYQYQKSAVHSYSSVSWRTSLRFLIQAKSEKDQSSVFLARGAFICFLAIESSRRSNGFLRGYMGIKELFYMAYSFGCFSSETFDDYVLSFWTKIMIFLCSHRHFALAYAYWELKTRIMNLIKKNKLIDEGE